VGTIIDDATTQAANPAATGGVNLIALISGSSVAVQDGDILVLEVFVRQVHGANTNSANSILAYGGTASPFAVDDNTSPTGSVKAGFLMSEAIINFKPQWRQDSLMVGQAVMRAACW
jgi:hypothetical protein